MEDKLYRNPSKSFFVFPSATDKMSHFLWERENKKYDLFVRHVICQKIR